jgi:hypothetical protein
MPRKTAKRTKRGSGLQSLFGIKPTKAADAEVFKGSNGILISKSKTDKRPLYSTDGGKTWDYLFNWSDTFNQTPLNPGAGDAYNQMKKQKEAQNQQAYMKSDAEYRARQAANMAEINASRNEWARQTAKQYGLPDTATYEEVKAAQDKKFPQKSSSYGYATLAPESSGVGSVIGSLFGGKKRKTRKHKRRA